MALVINFVYIKGRSVLQALELSQGLRALEPTSVFGLYFPLFVSSDREKFQYHALT